MKIISWKTTSMGVLAILGSLITIITAFVQTGNPPDNLFALIGVIMGGVGLIKARDNDKTSEETGAKVWEAERKRKELNQ